MSRGIWGPPSRTLVEECLSLDIAVLKENGYLDGDEAAGRTYSWIWPDGWKMQATIKVTIGGRGGPRLYLKMADAPEQMICLDRTKPHYGGVRWWLKCECGERCSKLYLRFGEDQFRCRKSLNLTYESQNLRPVWRNLKQARRLRERLQSDERSVEFPRKPKGMWYRTFKSLLEQQRDLEDQTRQALQGWFAQNAPELSGVVERISSLKPRVQQPPAVEASSPAAATNTPRST
jgi:hypothetical protein